MSAMSPYMSSCSGTRHNRAREPRRPLADGDALHPLVTRFKVTQPLCCAAYKVHAPHPPLCHPFRSRLRRGNKGSRLSTMITKKPYYHTIPHRRCFSCRLFFCADVCGFKMKPSFESIPRSRRGTVRNTSTYKLFHALTLTLFIAI